MRGPSPSNNRKRARDGKNARPLLFFGRLAFHKVPPPNRAPWTKQRGTTPFCAHMWSEEAIWRGTIPDMGVLFRGTTGLITGDNSGNNAGSRNNVRTAEVGAKLTMGLFPAVPSASSRPLPPLGSTSPKLAPGRRSTGASSANLGEDGRGARSGVHSGFAYGWRSSALWACSSRQGGISALSDNDDPACVSECHARIRLKVTFSFDLFSLRFRGFLS